MNPVDQHDTPSKLTQYEWGVIVVVPLLFIAGIRFLAVFYASLGMVLIVFSYLLFALSHYHRHHQRLHVKATMEYLSIALFVALLYIMFS